MDQNVQNENLKALMEAAKKDIFTFNEKKCLYNIIVLKETFDTSRLKWRN